MPPTVHRPFPLLPILLCAALLFVWPLPGTIALRYLLISLAGIAVFASFRTKGRGLRRQEPLVAVLVGLSLWFLFQALAISAETSWALDELRGQWVPAVAACAIGIFLAVGVGRQGQPKVLAMLAAPLLLLVVLGIGQSVWHLVRYHQLLRMEVPLTGGHLEMSVVINALLSVAIADLLCRAASGIRLLPVTTPIVLFAIGCALAEGYIANARNGIIGTAFLATMAVFLALREPKLRQMLRSRWRIALVTVTAFVAIGAAILARDARWDFLDTVPVAWDIRNNTAWLAENRPVPRLPDGQPVEISAYIRVAFIRAGLELIAEHPFGVGYGRNAFGHALVQAYPDSNVGHAHSGWIDLGIATGLPGLLLWSLFMTILVRMGWVGWRDRRDGFALALLLLTTEYSLRMALDSVNRDHMLQTFLFLVGFLSVREAKNDERTGDVVVRRRTCDVA